MGCPTTTLSIRKPLFQLKHERRLDERREPRRLRRIVAVLFFFGVVRDRKPHVLLFTLLLLLWDTPSWHTVTGLTSSWTAMLHLNVVGWEHTEPTRRHHRKAAPPPVALHSHDANDVTRLESQLIVLCTVPSS
jgi:hypothetical protein